MKLIARGIIKQYRLLFLMAEGLISRIVLGRLAIVRNDRRLKIKFLVANILQSLMLYVMGTMKPAAQRSKCLKMEQIM